MSLMKWFRKNNRKIMAIAIVGLLVVWLGGSALKMTCGYSGPRAGKAVALFGKNNKITIADISLANSELTILRQTRADLLLRSSDVHGILLSELLFSQASSSPMLLVSLRQAIRTNELRISDEQIIGMLKKTQTDEIYWHLLKKEAEAAGIAIANEGVVNSLRQIIPKLFNGASYAQVINSFISRGISEEAILSAFAKFYAVTEYTRIACSQENLTRTQLSQLVSDERQTMDTQLVKVHAELFTDQQPQPDEKQINELFQKYKAYYPGQISEDNPYGFGYKLDNRLQLEYLIIKLDDIEKIIQKPTQQDKERYYLTHASEFTGQKLSDPNDPNSTPIQYTLSFGQVARLITSRMTSEKIAQKADAIFAQARQLAEEKYDDKDTADLTAEQLKELSADFGDIAEKLTKENSVNVYPGKTGLLSVLGMQQDPNLIGLFIRPASQGQMPYFLTQLVFSIEQLDSRQLTLSGAPKPKLYETIGPLSDFQGKTTALVRVVDVAPAAEPQSLDTTFSAAKVRLGQSENDDDIYSVRDKVIEDCKILAAMQTAKQIADDFLAMAHKDGWEKTLEKFNQQYPAEEPDEPNNFQMEDWTTVDKPSPDLTQIVAAQNKGLPGARFAMEAHNRNKMVIEKLFKLVPDNSNIPDELPVIVEVKPDHGYYCIKSLSVKRIDRSVYDRIKAISAFRQDSIEAQNLGAVHYQPANILERMNFRPIQKPKLQAEPNEPALEPVEPSQKT